MPPIGPSRKALCANASRRNVLAGGVGALALPVLGLPACRASQDRFDADVIILGAGLSGLNAALWLAESGRDVLVVDAAERIGGRLHTLDHGDGKSEAGGEQVGANYARILDRGEALGVETVPVEGPPPATTHILEGRLYDPEDWRTSDPLDLPERYRGSTPSAALFRIGAATNPLSDAEAWRDVTGDPSADTMLAQANISEHARALIGHTLNGNSLETYSAANLWRTLQLYSQSRSMGPSRSIIGGAKALPIAMAAALPRPVRTGFRVSALSVEDRSVSIEAQDGSRLRAAHCICALPFGALRRIRFDAPVGSRQAEAIAGLPYTQITQLHFRLSDSYWETDGLPANMWTDTPYERIFIDRHADGTPTGFGRCWINGEAATEIDLSGLTDTMARLRPAMAGRIEPVSEVRWTRSDPLSGGAYMHFAPGQIEHWAGQMGDPAGRLHFAGEHLGVLHTGMEAAMESGERAAFALMDP